MEIRVWVPRNGDGSGLAGMPEVVVAAARANQLPTVVPQDPNNVTDFPMRNYGGWMRNRASQLPAPKKSGDQAHDETLAAAQHKPCVEGAPAS